MTTQTFKASATNSLFTIALAWITSLFDKHSPDRRADDGVWTSGARGL